MTYQNDHDFHFYSSENDGYRGGLGGYTDPTPGQSQPPRPPKKDGFATKAVALALTCALLGGGAGAGGAALYLHLNPQQTVASATLNQENNAPTVSTVVNQTTGKALTPEQLYAQNLASCVGITISTTAVNFYGQTTTAAASGSGFVLSADGYIVTNYHVIEDALKDDSVTIEVSFANSDKYAAKVVGAEKENDVAVLKIEATGLRPVVLGDSDQLVVGQTVYAIGNPLGELTYTLTDGMVSALDRLITTDESVTMNMLQTNCAINPGNSGGPLFDASGKVIGIVTAKQTRSSSGVSAEGLGFAIPINDVKAILSDLKDFGYVTGRPFLGISGQNISEAIQRYGIPAGAEVVAIGEGSCAQKAGMQVGDIITAVDGTAVDSQSALSALLASEYKAGDTIQVTVVRQQEELTLTVTLDERNEKTEAAIPEVEQNQQGQNGGSYGGYYDWPYGAFPYFW